MRYLEVFCIGKLMLYFMQLFCRAALDVKLFETVNNITTVVTKVYVNAKKYNS